MTSASAKLIAALECGLIRRFSGATQAVYFTLAIVCGDEPKALSVETIAAMSGLSRRKTLDSVRSLIDARFITCRPLGEGKRDKFTGRYAVPNPANFATSTSERKPAFVTA